MEEKYNLCIRLRNGKIRTYEYDSWSRALRALHVYEKFKIEGDPMGWIKPVSDKLKNPHLYE